MESSKTIEGNNAIKIGLALDAMSIVNLLQVPLDMWYNEYFLSKSDYKRIFILNIKIFLFFCLYNFK